MDIDILQVQETVTVDTNGTVIDTTMTDQTDVAAVAYITSIGENGDAAPTTTSTEDGCFAVAKGKATAAADHDDGSEAPWWLKDIPKLDKCKLILVGFSKGCVVLNQVCVLGAMRKGEKCSSFLHACLWLCHPPPPFSSSTSSTI